jgi:hypothetical protein
MELSRRDAVAALAGLGVAGAGVGAATLALDGGDGYSGASGDETLDVATLVAAAETVYPGAVTGVEEFVRTFVAGRIRDPAHREGLVAAVGQVDDAARDWYDAPYAELEADTRDAVLRELGADTAEPDPEGSLAERVRYYVVNDLLYALYSSPTGGELVGIENPIGHPGGTTSYQRGPTDG